MKRHETDLIGRRTTAPPAQSDVAALGAKCRTVTLPCGIEYSLFLDVESDDDMSRALLAGTLPEQTLVELMLSVVRPGDVVVDLGAHVGTFTFAAAAAGCEVIAVEASPRNVAFLKAGVAANGFDRVRVIQAAVGDQGGSVEFCPRGAVGHLATPLTDFERIEVPAVCVDELLGAAGLERVSFIKMDVEGSEIRAIRGMSQLLCRSDAPPVLFESNGHTLWFYGQRPNRLKAEMEAAGYRNYLVGCEGLRPVCSGDFQIDCRVDYFAVKGSVPDRVHPPVARPMSRSEMVERIVATYEAPEEASRAHLLREIQDAPVWLRQHPMVTDVVRRCGVAGSPKASSSQGELDEIIEMRDPEIDLGDLLQRIGRKLASREELPPVVRPPGHLIEQHDALSNAVVMLRQAVERYGTLGAEQAGFTARAKRLAKRCIRKLIRRHVDQQIEIHWALVALLEQVLSHDRQLLAYLDATARCVDRQDEFVVDWLDRLAERVDVLEESMGVARVARTPSDRERRCT